ncbi:LuxR family transcriptional regulator [Lentzea sp. NEAU-D13]|uniref:LuxR family transcriptional regulator n=1 Tax=Lentzea alba TaxID=2714351 RepID=A0A7C9VUV8_9PSEU|nr:LuxR C-terminal-related transcriptional regulator [Lentzea alba]NGY65174.1 LuxR family transcriptional regulator [Lentzea alba]
MRTTGNLPAELTSFVGRRRELDEVKRLLGESRLVTLTGVGGTGKTRLALRTSTALRRAFRDGVWFVDMTQLRDAGLLTQEVQGPEMLAYLVGATLGQPEPGNGGALDALVEWLRGRQLLLVLDNCEHLIPCCAIVADALLRGCPGLRLLVTSREPLGILGEVVYGVPPLPVPDPGRRTSRADLIRSESVALFLARGAAAVPGFELTDDNHCAVAELCRGMDGLPLAIELAAARLRVFTPQQILERMTDRFALLSRGSRTGPERQRTLRACMDWSFDLCAKPERVLWARLSVFVGGCELDAVEGVCADEHVPLTELPELVAALVDKSVLVRGDSAGGTARYRMLQTIRDYGQDKARSAGEEALLRRRHRDWYQELLDRAHDETSTERYGYWLARLRREQPNLRAAVEFCLTEPGEAEAALRLAVAVPRLYWRARGLFSEGRRWLDRALAQTTGRTVLRARALMVNSQLAFWQGDTAAGMRLVEQSEDLARETGAPLVLAYAAFLRGLAALHANDLEKAMETLERAEVMLSAVPPHDLDLDLDLRFNVLLTQASAAALAGEHERADSCVRELLTIAAHRGEGLHLSFVIWPNALNHWLLGDLTQATEQSLRALRIKLTCGADDRYGTALCLELLAWITADQQRHRRAATLLGAAAARWTDIGASITSYRHLVVQHDACARRIREAMGDAAFADAFAVGQNLALDDLPAFAFEEEQGATPPLESLPSPLTRREQQVAELVADGLSNKEIAARLVIARRTAEGHVERILKKLGFASRAQLAAWVAERRHSAVDGS